MYGKYDWPVKQLMGAKSRNQKPQRCTTRWGGEMRQTKSTDKGFSLRLPASILAVTALVFSGAVYRVAAFHLKHIVETAIALPVPLRAFPTTISNWVGKDIPIDENIRRLTANDDFINRLYENKSDNKWANVYLSYSARPRTMLGHRPDVCYAAAGWIHDRTERSEVILHSGRKIPVLIHRFHRAGLRYDEIVVVNYYIVNGRITAEEKGFTGLAWRTPNIAGNPARYVAQVQISSVVENAARTAAQDITDLILEFLPDENGLVKTAKYADQTVRDRR